LARYQGLRFPTGVSFMAEVLLPPLRPGFAYVADLTFPAGFLAAGESIRAKLRRYQGQPTADATFTSTRVGDTISLELSAAQTASLEAGTYLTEAIIYQPAAPLVAEIPITDNLYRIEVSPSPSL
jgi:hypothetical protein